MRRVRAPAAAASASTRSTMRFTAAASVVGLSISTQALISARSASASKGGVFERSVMAASGRRSAVVEMAGGAVVRRDLVERRVLGGAACEGIGTAVAQPAAGERIGGVADGARDRQLLARLVHVRARHRLDQGLRVRMSRAG